MDADVYFEGTSGTYSRVEGSVGSGEWAVSGGFSPRPPFVRPSAIEVEGLGGWG